MKSLHVGFALLLFTVPVFCQQPDANGDSVTQAPAIERSAKPEMPSGEHPPKGVHHVLITLVVDGNGDPKDVAVKKAAGYGFDEKAVEAVKKYKFKPAMKGGKPVKSEVTIDVKFETY
jgi:protein TonB